MTKDATGQSIERFAGILRTLADHQEEGARLTDIVAATGLSKSTVHRILHNLAQQGLVEQPSGSTAFYLSFEMFALGAAAANRYGLVDLARPHLVELERRCNDTIYLSSRSGAEAICIDRVEGGYPIKVLTLAVGDRRPLGAGAGSMALLSALEDDEINELLDHNRKSLDQFIGFDPVRIWKLIRETREQGFAFNDGQIIPEMCAIAIPIPDSSGRPVASLSIAATAGRMEPGRREQLIIWLREEVESLRLQLSRFRFNRHAKTAGDRRKRRIENDVHP